MPNISEKHAQALRDVRSVTDERLRKRRKAAIFAEIKSAARIPSSTKIKLEIDDRSNAHYGALKDADTGLLIEPAAPAYAGTSGGANARPIEPKYPFPTDVKPQAAPVKEAAWATKVAPMAPKAPMATGGEAAEAVRLQLGSISLDDAVSLLRVEADTRDTYATTTDFASAQAFVKGDRLFFVL